MYLRDMWAEDVRAVPIRPWDTKTYHLWQDSRWYTVNLGKIPSVAKHHFCQRKTTVWITGTDRIFATAESQSIWTSNPQRRNGPASSIFLYQLVSHYISRYVAMRLDQLYSTLLDFWHSLWSAAVRSASPAILFSAIFKASI